MKNVAAIFIFFLCWIGCKSVSQDADNYGSCQNLVTIEYTLDPMRRFTIVGTGVANVKLENLADVIMKHQQQHPGAIYELYAEVKCVPETSDKIIESIRSAGVILKHYWAPVCSDSQSFPGKYGHGYVDILADK